MRDEDIDLMLSRDDNIVPSSGFTASVMDAVTREATAPPPIPFPWKRALPGRATALSAAGWIAGALVLTLGSVAFSIRMARRV